MAGHYLKEIGYGFISVNLPLELYAEIIEIAESREESKLNFFNKLINDFINGVDQNTKFLSTRRESQCKALALWLEPEIFEAIQILAKKEQLSLRAICYTGLCNFLEEHKIALYGNVA